MTLYQSTTTPTVEPSARDLPDAVPGNSPASDTIRPHEARDAYRDVERAVRDSLAANWDMSLPRVAVVERNGIDTVYVSTATRLAAQARTDIRGAVRAALAPYAWLAPFTSVVFLTRGAP